MATKHKIDFNQIKKSVGILQALGLYVDVSSFKQKNDVHTGHCLLHGENKDGELKVNTAKNAWYCITCKKGGNVLDLVAQKEDVPIKKAAERLADEFQINGDDAECSASREREDSESDNITEDEDIGRPISGSDEKPERRSFTETGTNAPLEFPGLKDLNAEHEVLNAKSFTPETVSHFKAGFFSGKGLMHSRIAIPIHTIDAELVGYAGRSASDDARGEPDKYADNFRPDFELYNAHRAIWTPEFMERKELYIVEDFYDVWRLHQAGFPNTVGVINEKISYQQILHLQDLIDDSGRITVVLSMADESRSVHTWFALALRHYVKVIALTSAPAEHSESDIVHELTS